MKVKFKKCGHISNRIIPESDGNECYVCGWDKFNNRPEVIAFKQAQYVIGFSRFKTWIKDSLIYDFFKQHFILMPKARPSNLRVSLAPLGFDIRQSSGNLIINETEMYIEEI